MLVTGGIGSVGALAPQHTGSKGGSPLGELLGILTSHPGASLDLKQNILSSVMGGLASAQQAKQAAYQDALQSSEDYAMSPTATSEGLQGFMDIAGSGLGPHQQAQLGAQAPSLGALLPDSGSSTLDQQDQAALGQILVQTYQAKPGDSDPADPATLYAMRDQARQTAIGAGKDPAGIEAAVTYAEHVFAQLAGISDEAANVMGRGHSATPQDPTMSSPGMGFSPGAIAPSYPGGFAGGYIPAGANPAMG